MNEFNKKIIAFLIIFAILSTSFSPIFARKARAQWIDISQAAKEYGLDALAFQIVNSIIKKISASTINWINGGFKGSPAYVTDPEAYFQDMGDKIAGQYIFSNPNLNFLCGPISAKIKLALTQNYIQEQQWQCTLTQVGKNLDDFMGNFENGGWDSFFEVTQNQHMNPIGAYLQAENELNLQIATRQGTKQKELDWGQGFMSFKQCPDNMKVTDSASDQQYRDSGYKTGDCLGGEKTVTPGSVIQNKLNSVLDQSESRLVMADEINEMLSALISQLTQKLVGGAIGGLRGLSSPSSSDNNQTFANQLSNDTSSTDYFGNAPDTSVLDVPLPGSNGGASGSTLMPLDRDCINVDITTLNTMAQDSANQRGVTFDEAMRDLDCDPVGIN